MGVGLIGGQNGSVDSDTGGDYNLHSLLRDRDVAAVEHAASPMVGDVDEPQLATPPPLQDTVAPPAEALSVVEPAAPNSIEGIICSFDWPQGCDYWIAVASCESSLYARALGFRSEYVGLLQIWTGHGYAYEWLLDPYNNTLAAWELSREGTYTAPWPYCRWQ